MANHHEPQFFKPLLPGFYSGVTIPLAFYTKHIEGKPNQGKWTIRLDASHKTWKVIQEGRRLTGGWKALCKAHGLRIGDLVMFKKEGDMVFHVTPFGPSFTEIQYTPPRGDDAADGAEVTPSFSFDFCFLAEVTRSNLSEDKLHLPVEATQCTALNKQRREAILMNKEWKSWSVSLRFNEADGMFFIRKGWRRFCVDNRCTVGDLFVFNVVGDGETSPLLCVCPKKKEYTEILTNYLSSKNGKSLTIDPVIVIEEEGCEDGSLMMTCCMPYRYQVTQLTISGEWITPNINERGMPFNNTLSSFIATQG